MFKKRFIAILFLVSLQCCPEVLIMVPVYNRPDFIEMQYKTFKKFLKDDYTLMVFNDASNEYMCKKIENECAKYEITCIRVPQNLHNIHPFCGRAPASFRHGEVLQFAFENYGFKHNDIVTPVDSDMFLIEDFSIREYLGDYDLTYIKTCIGCPKGERFSISTHFGPINMPKIPSPETMRFIPSMYPDGEFFDTGENTHFYFLKHQDKLNMKKIDLVRGVYCDFELNKTQDVFSQLVQRGYRQDVSQLIVEIYDVADQFARRNPNNSTIYYDTDIGFYEKNIFLDYKHGTSYDPEIGPREGHIMEPIKDKMVKTFVYRLLE